MDGILTALLHSIEKSHENIKRKGPPALEGPSLTTAPLLGIRHFFWDDEFVEVFGAYVTEVERSFFKRRSFMVRVFGDFGSLVVTDFR